MGMMHLKKIAGTISFIIAIFVSANAQKAPQAQTIAATLPVSVPIKTYHVGIFAPLFLDSVFNENGNFRFKQGIPKLIVPGLEFVQGAELALDSLSLPNTNIVLTIYDSKSYDEPVPTLIQEKKLDSLDIIIGAVKDAEYKQLADFAAQKKIPFISATYPNDGGIAGNPYLVIMNPTLKSHCEAIYSYLVENHSTDKIFLVRKKGTQEDKIADYFKAINLQDGKPLLNIQTLNFDDAQQNSDNLKKKLDSTKQTIIIGGSLDEHFATDLTLACHDLFQSYPITLIGMPNWDGFKQLVKSDVFNDFPVYYTAPYFNDKLDDNSKVILNGYQLKYKGKPTDMAFKGYECTSYFTNLLIKYSTNVMNNLNDKNFKVFSDYNFRPVMLGKYDFPDYFENKHLYFIKIQGGNFTKAW
jgi:ABC-type branched-subunit amino acid transport system substrate-binding protein